MKISSFSDNFTYFAIDFKTSSFDTVNPTIQESC